MTYFFKTQDNKRSSTDKDNVRPALLNNTCVSALLLTRWQSEMCQLWHYMTRDQDAEGEDNVYQDSDMFCNKHTQNLCRM